VRLLHDLVGIWLAAAGDALPARNRPAAEIGSLMPETEMTSFRLPSDIVTALRKLAEEQGETLSDVLRQAALAKLGICPTCGRRTEVGKRL
jgi:hypothetical protein